MKMVRIMRGVGLLSALALFLLFSVSIHAQRLLTPQNIAPELTPSASFTVEQGSSNLQPTPESSYPIVGIGASPNPEQILQCSGSVTFSGDTSWLDIQQILTCSVVPDARYGADFEAIAYEVRVNPTAVANLPPGEYTASYTAVSSLRYISGLDGEERSDSSNGTGTFTLTVTGEEPPVDLPPTAAITSPSGSQTINAGESVSFAGQGSSDNPDAQLSFAWNFGDGRTLNQQNPGAVTFDTPGGYTVTFTVTDQNNGLSASDSVVVTVEEEEQEPPVDPPPTAAITSPGSNTTITAGETVTFAGQAGSDNPDAQLSFAWSFGDGRTSTEQNPGAVTFDTPGSYTVTFTVTDQDNGLSASDSVILLVEEEETPGEPGEPPIEEVIRDAMTNLTPGEGSPQFEAARVIAEICPDGARELSPSFQAACNAMVGSSLSDDPEEREQARDAIAAVTPDTVGSVRSDALSSINVQAINIAGRLASLRAGVGGFSAAGLQFDIDGNRISGRHLHGLVEALTHGGAASSDDAGFSRLGVFVSGSIGSGDRSRTANADGFDFDVYGLTLGVDYRLSDSLIVGAAVGYSSTEADTFTRTSPIDGSIFRRGSLDADNYSFTLYGSHYQTDEFFIDGSISYGRGDYDQRRRVQYTLPSAIAGPDQAIVNQTFDASFKGDQLGLSLLAGYDFRRDALTLTPTARLQYTRARIDSYSERQGSNPDAAGADLNVEIDDQRYRSFALGVGGQVSYAMSQSWGVLLPFAGLEYVHDFEKNDKAVTGRFVNDDVGGTQGKVDFNLPVDSRDQNYFNLSLGVSAQFVNGMAGFVSYDRILGYDDLKQQRVSAGLRFEF